MDKILVTGGAGYIGSHTVKELVKAGFEVIVVDNLSTGHEESVKDRATFEICDVGDKEKLIEIFNEYQPKAVIDFAAYLDVGDSMENPEKYLKNNVENFVTLLDTMNDVGCKFMIKSSTAAVYGNPQNDEDFPLLEDYTERFKPAKSYLLHGKWNGKDVASEDFFQGFIEEYKKIYNGRPKLALTDDDLAKLRIPLSIYGLSKALDEILLKKYDETCGIKSITLRYFNVCGADPDGGIGEDKPNPSTLMILCVMQILGKVPKLSVFGNDYPTKDGTGIRDYIHVTDIATGHVSALSRLLKNQKTDTFNLGTGKGSTVMEVIEAVDEASRKKVQYEVVGRRSGDPTISVANADKANEILHWKARYSLSDMAQTAWKWHSSHPNGFESDIIK